MSRARAVVFAYHDVGVRGLEVLRAGGADVALVVTHADQPGEAMSVAQTAVPILPDDTAREVFPGAFCSLGDRCAVIEEARRAPGRFDELTPGLHVAGIPSAEIIGVCGDGMAILVCRLRVDGHIMDALDLEEQLSS